MKGGLIVSADTGFFGTSTAVILVLFILVAIIGRAGHIGFGGFGW